LFVQFALLLATSCFAQYIQLAEYDEIDCSGPVSSYSYIYPSTKCLLFENDGFLSTYGKVEIQGTTVNFISCSDASCTTCFTDGYVLGTCNDGEIYTQTSNIKSDSNGLYGVGYFASTDCHSHDTEIELIYFPNYMGECLESTTNFEKYEIAHCSSGTTNFQNCTSSTCTSSSCIPGFSYSPIECLTALLSIGEVSIQFTCGEVPSFPNPNASSRLITEYHWSILLLVVITFFQMFF